MVLTAGHGQTVGIKRYIAQSLRPALRTQAAGHSWQVFHLRTGMRTERRTSVILSHGEGLEQGTCPRNPSFLSGMSPSPDLCPDLSPDLPLSAPGPLIPRQVLQEQIFRLERWRTLTAGGAPSDKRAHPQHRPSSQRLTLPPLSSGRLPASATALQVAGMGWEPKGAPHSH